MDKPVSRLHARRALLPEGWARDVGIDISADGTIGAVRPGSRRDADSEAVDTLLPGLPNAHSHAFQRALTGRLERAGTGAASFWSWRDAVYRFIGRLGPEDLSCIARLVYMEMLLAGYTAVAEFHYLHHGPTGQRWPQLAFLGRLMIDAARDAGIRITLLPVLYQYGGFDETPPSAAQQRFVCRIDEYFELWQATDALADDRVAAGLAFHSLRAVSRSAMDELLAVRRERRPLVPVHIHVAEQLREVEECVAWSGLRPVEWLLEQGLVDAHWCLVHATHMTPAECAGLAASGAVVGLCPTTEANLGDGLFPLRDYLAQDGRIAIGSDSQVAVNPFTELRWLEYGQRLATGQRHVAASAAVPHNGARLYRAALAGGSAVIGQQVGAIRPGMAADLLELDTEVPDLAGTDGDELLDCLVFAGHDNAVRNVMVGGRWVVRDGKHPRQAAIRADFVELQRRLHGRVH